MTLRTRWLGTVPYREALDLQRALFSQSNENYLLLMEHPDTITLGRSADPANVLVQRSSIGPQSFDIVDVDRGGDVTYHGPGQLVGYPIVTLADHDAGEMPSTRDYVLSIEHLIIGALGELGVADLGIVEGRPGVWVDPQGKSPAKLAAVGVKISRGRTMHGFAINVEPDLSKFGSIVPCGIAEFGVTSLRELGNEATINEVVDAVIERAGMLWSRGSPAVDRADVVWRKPHDDMDLSPFSRGAGAGEVVRNETAVVSGTETATASDNHGASVGPAVSSTSVRLTGRLAEAGVSGGIALHERKPDWMKARVRLGENVMSLRSTVREAGLTTVCEEAGCPNLSECWSDGTATFMVCGERCTRKCGFCLVDTRKPEPLSSDEPQRVATAVADMGLDFAVLTMVARDDLADGGAQHVADTVRAIHERCPETSVEVLISDLKGSAESLALILAADPEVLNHNIETVARLQRAVRPSASYARSLGVLSRSVAVGARTKSGMVVGMGETDAEIRQTLVDLASVGTHIVTIGQYLRPTSNHLPVERWWHPDAFAAWKEFGESLGIDHVESSPLTRSSYHAKQAASGAEEMSIHG